MSSRARRVTQTATIVSWLDTVPEVQMPVQASAPQAVPGRRPGAAAVAAAPAPPPDRESFAKAFAQGERAGAAAAQEQNVALTRELSRTLDDLMRVRAEMIHQTERQMVQLALAVARRIVRREVSIDHDLLLAMMRVALDRLSDAARITVRLHPAEHDAVAAGLSSPASGNHVTIVADARIARGGCRLESDYGEIEAGVDAQIQEIARALLGEDAGVAS